MNRVSRFDTPSLDSEQAHVAATGNDSCATQGAVRWRDSGSVPRLATSMATHAMQIREMTSSDLDSIIRTHLESFPGFFLTCLGPAFLALLYRFVQDDPDGIVLVACVDHGVTGFIAGVTDQRGYYRRMIRQHKWAFAVAAAGSAFRNPRIALRLLRALKRPAEAERAAASACLMSIAVRTAYQERGIGTALVQAFCRELSRRGAQAVCLTTDAFANEPTNGFYRTLGFELRRRFTTPEGRVMNEYVMPLDR